MRRALAALALLGIPLLGLASVACVSTRDDWQLYYDHGALAQLAPGTPREELLARLGGPPRGEYRLPEGHTAIAFGHGPTTGPDGEELPESTCLLELDADGRYVGLLHAWPEVAGAARSDTDLPRLIEERGPLQPVGDPAP